MHRGKQIHLLNYMVGRKRKKEQRNTGIDKFGAQLKPALYIPGRPCINKQAQKRAQCRAKTEHYKRPGAGNYPAVGN